MNYGTNQGHFLGWWKMILVYLGRWSYGRFQDDNNIFYKMKNDLTTRTWQDDIWCPIIILLLCTSDVLCLFLFCIFLLYHTDPQVKVQIRILLKDKYVKLCQNANTGNHTLISWTMLIGFLYFRETTCLPKYFSRNIWTFYYCISLSCIV